MCVIVTVIQLSAVSWNYKTLFDDLKQFFSLACREIELLLDTFTSIAKTNKPFYFYLF